MAWRQEKSQEEIIKEALGITTEEAKAKLAELDIVKASLAAKDTEIATMNNNLATLTTEVTELKKNQKVQEPPKNDPQQHVLRDWMEDADGAFQDRVKPVVGLSLDVKAEVVLDRVIRKVERDPRYSLFEKEFKDLVKSGDLVARGQEAFVQNCWDVVVGRHVNDIMRDQAAGKGTYFVESGRNQSNGGTQPEKKPVDFMTEDEKKEAARFGLTPEQWLKSRGGIKFVGTTPANM